MKFTFPFLLRLSLGLVLLTSLCLALGVQVRTAHAQSTLTVTDCSSDSQLQADVSTANGDNAGDTITFSCSGDIKLTSSPTITGSMTIDGSGKSVTLDGNNARGIFTVNSGVTLTLTALTLANARSFGAGAISNDGTLHISNSTFSNNHNGQEGGAIYNTGTVTISNSTFTNNSGDACGCGQGGGAIDSFGTVTISNSTFTNNSSYGNQGGAISNSFGTMSISNSTFSQNSAEVGGAISNYATLTISNSTIANNSASGDGGAIYINNGGTVNVSNSTIANNSAYNGGGAFIFSGGISFSGSIVAENSANVNNNCSSDVGASAIIDHGYNLESGTDCGFTGTGSKQNSNPELASTLANGTLALQQGSPAIDQVPLASCPSTDQRGNARPDADTPAETACDMGAYESNYPPDSDLGLTNMPANITTNATSSQGAVVTYTSPTATDENGDSSTASVTCSPASGSIFPIGTTTVTCTATDNDDSNSPVMQSFTVTVNNDNDLALTNVPANITTSATSSQGASVTYTPPTATDESGDTTTASISCDHASGSIFPIGTTTVTCTATDSDDSNSPVTGSFTVTVQPLDNDLALTGLPSNMTIPSTSSQGAIVNYTPPTATDEAGDNPGPSVSCSPASGTTFPIGTTTVTCTATDSDDTNSPVTGSFTVTVQPLDTDLALTNLPANITVAATSAQGAVVTYTLPTATDEAGDNPGPSVSCSPAPGSTFPVGQTTVTCTATDSDDLNSPVTGTFTVTVTDSDLALTNVPADITTNATNAQGASVSYTAPTATDEDSSSPAVSCSPTSGSTFAIGTTTVTCTASDSDDTNSPVSASFKVTVVDNLPPSLQLPPSPVTASATSAQGAIVTYTVTATDPVYPANQLTVSCSPTSGSTFPVGNTTVNCSASDPAGNSTTGSFTVTVTDSDLALTNVPANISANATSSQGAVVTYTNPTATDEDGSSPAVTCSPASGTTFAIGTTKVTCTATDSDDTPSTVSASFNVTVVDKLSPNLQLPSSPVTANATSAQGAAVSYTVTATDPVYPSSQLTINCTPASGNTFPIGNTTVKCTVTDPANNSASGSFTVTVVDKLPPVLHLPASPVTVNATSPQGATVNYSVTATDPVYPSSQLTIMCSPTSGSTFPIGTSTVKCSVSDPAGNSATGSFQVVVNGASTQVNETITLVNSFHLPSSVQSSFDTQLQAVQADLTAKNTARACSDLTGFINHVKAQSGKQLTVNQANQLLAAAKQIQTVLGC